MYTLRQVDQERGETNIYLGKHYVLTHRERHHEEFNKLVKELGYDPELKNLFGFIYSESEARHLPLSTGYINYIVMPNGKTLERLN